MKREEAKKEFWNSTFKELFCMGLDYETVIKMPYKGSAVDKWIDKIYDELEEDKPLSLIAEEHNELINHIQLSREEIEKLKARSCDNCKHFLQVAKNYPRRICSILNCSDIGGCGDYFEYRVNNES